MTNKKYTLNADQIKDLTEHTGYCLITDKITVEGMKVGYMYREEPDDETDSGWRFMSGTENEAYMDEPDNAMVCDLNTAANFDQAIIPYLDREIGAELERVEGTDRFKDIED